MTHPYAQLIGYKQWADRDLCDVVAKNFHKLKQEDAAIVLRILDHFHVVDRIFRHHLKGEAQPHRAPRSDTIPDIETLARGIAEVDDWYTSYVATLRPEDFDAPLDFTYSNGAPARMTRGEMLLHVCLHGTYHRGNAGVVLQKGGIMPNNDRMTDFLEAA